ncbi:PEGA domain-containing protein [Cerasicoccus fimbriatus]|uniref:PEGA domain-containing protein n=1 Tax=Cerasicoccus fimbriatus TaxID=3014554 RepID=UPI0022B4AA95|nr:PEGA domain-containing protein [Cerasicoccus sp. TK19100]
MPTSIFRIWILFMLCVASVAHAQLDGRKTAVFVNNLAGVQLADKANALESLLAANLNGQGFNVISRQEVANSLANDPEIEDLGRALASSSSALRLAQTLGADYLLVANLVSFGQRQVKYEGYDIATANTVYRLRVSYSLLESSGGAGLVGEEITVSEALRDDATIEIIDNDLLNGLITEAAALIAQSAREEAKLGNIPVAPQPAAPVTFAITPRLQDIALPNVVIDKDNVVTVSADKFPIEATGVSVELDGVVLGSAPGTFEARPGLHQLRLIRDGFVSWERNVNLSDGFVLVAQMNFSAEGQQQWQELSAFLEELKSGRELDDAEAERIRGEAEALRQSGFRVDTNQAPNFIYENSLWGNPFPVPYKEAE